MASLACHTSLTRGFHARPTVARFRTHGDAVRRPDTSCEARIGARTWDIASVLGHGALEELRQNVTSMMAFRDFFGFALVVKAVTNLSLKHRADFAGARFPQGRTAYSGFSPLLNSLALKGFNAAKTLARNQFVQLNRMATLQDDAVSI